jgi:glutathione S-transferase
MRQEPADPEKFKKMEEAVQWLDGFLADSEFAAGNEVSIADYTLYSSFSTFDVVGYDFSKFENVSRWYRNCEKNLPGAEENNEGIEVMKKMMEQMKIKNQPE